MSKPGGWQERKAKSIIWAFTLFSCANKICCFVSQFESSLVTRVQTVYLLYFPTPSGERGGGQEGNGRSSNSFIARRWCDGGKKLLLQDAWWARSTAATARFKPQILEYKYSKCYSIEPGGQDFLPMPSKWSHRGQRNLYILESSWLTKGVLGWIFFSDWSDWSRLLKTSKKYDAVTDKTRLYQTPFSAQHHGDVLILQRSWPFGSLESRLIEMGDNVVSSRSITSLLPPLLLPPFSGWAIKHRRQTKTRDH